jgi:hypothetical protein
MVRAEICSRRIRLFLRIVLRLAAESLPPAIVLTSHASRDLDKLVEAHRQMVLRTSKWIRSSQIRTSWAPAS